MRFLLDVGVAASTAKYLRQRGHDAIHLLEQGLERLPDTEIAAKALREQRIILTHDLDFGRLVSLSKGRAPSVVTFRLSNMRVEEVNGRLDELLPRFAADLEFGALISVTDQRVRIRRLPVG